MNSLVPPTPGAPVPCAPRASAHEERASFDRKRSLVPWLALLLFLVEALLFTSAFERPDLRQATAAWARIFRLVSNAVPILIAVGTAGLLFAPDATEKLRLRDRRPTRLQAPWLALHLASLLLFWQVSGQVLGNDLWALDMPGLWFAAWLTLGLAAGVSLTLTCISIRDLGQLLVHLRSTLLLAFGVGLSAFAAGHLTDTALWDELGHVTLLGVHGLLKLLQFEPTLILPQRVVGTDRFLVEVGSGCSGWEGIGLMWVFLAGYLGFFRKELRFPAALWLPVIGTLVVFCANLVRIVLLIAIGDRWSPVIAVNAFHTRAGWIFFCAISLGLVAWSKHSGVFAVRRNLPQGQLDRVTLAYVGPLFALSATGLVTGAIAQGLDPLAPLGVLAGAIVLAWLGEARLPRSFHLSPATILFGVLGFLVWVPFVSGTSRPWAESLETLGPTWVPFWLAFKLVGTLAVVPWVEELFFRGYLPRRLARRAPGAEVARLSPVTLLVPSLLFGLLHQNRIGGLLTGIVFALAGAHRRQLGDAVLAHAITNGLLVLLAFSTGSSHWWFG